MYIVGGLASSLELATLARSQVISSSSSLYGIVLVYISILAAAGGKLCIGKRELSPTLFLMSKENTRPQIQ